jgi:glycerophosphoryl diester phosphodiesterase
MAKIKSLDGRLFTGLLFDRPLPDLPERLKRTKADAIFPRVSLVTERLARWARARGLFVGTWTVNETADLKRMVRLGVDAVATNYPERLAALR